MSKNNNEAIASCENCENCEYIGGGDHVCLQHQKLVLDDWSCTDDYLCCNGEDFVSRE